MNSAPNREQTMWPPARDLSKSQRMAAGVVIETFCTKTDIDFKRPRRRSKPKGQHAYRKGLA